MIYINAYSSLSSLGCNTQQITANLCTPHLPLLNYRDDLLINGQASYFGQIQGPLQSLDAYPCHNTRNNQISATCIQSLLDTIKQYLKLYGSDKIGIIAGTSTSGLYETEKLVKKQRSDFCYQMQEFGNTALFLADYLNIHGPCYSISTACSSSARVFISAARLIENNLCDAVLVVGTDSLCQIPINGFDGMEILSHQLCTPFCEGRNGINIGEACGAMLLSKNPSLLALLGYGESSDAYHISSPDPSGHGAIAAMQMALDKAQLDVEQLGYINLHGTGTIKNDAMESTAVAKLCGNKIPCSSTKYLTGHTLGAAGILEACILCYLLQYSLPLPKQDTTLAPLDKSLADCGLITQTCYAKFPIMMSNSFAFGGNNTSLIIGAV